MSDEGGIRHDVFYLGGEWTIPASSGRLVVSSPVTGAPIASVPMATRGEIDRAIEAASRALPGWAATSIQERAELLHRVGLELDARRVDLEELIAAEIGAPRSFISDIHVGAPIDRFLSAVEITGDIPVLSQAGRSRVRLEPIGVVAAITPWNYPLLQVAEKVAPALLAGCTVVLKPSEMTPLTAYVLAEAMHKAGAPAGVFNLVCGEGAGVGEHLVSSKGVDMISFTGSTRAGRRISALAAKRVKPTMMELGGKSPAVILADTGESEFDGAVSFTVRNCYENAGQTCTALTRLIVPVTRLARAEKIAVDVARSMTVGGPDDDAELGPLISEKQLRSVEGYVNEAVADGARLLVGGGRIEGRPGHFFQATVISGVTPSMRITREEIFGPVLVIQSAEDDAEAIQLANDSDYGLAGAVWGTDPDGVTSAAFAMRAGWITVNGAEPEGDLPFGGVKQSGHGREAGVPGVMEYLTTKVLTS